MADREIRLDLTANDEASDVIDDVADAGADLEKAGVTVPVDADTGDADDALDDVETTLERVEKQDWIVKVRADMADAIGEAQRVEDQLGEVEQAGEDAGRGMSGGSSVGVGAMRDLLGPMGDVVGQAGDMGESFTAAGELAVEKMGLAGTAAGDLATTIIPGVGAAIVAAAAVWGLFQANAEKAREKAAEVLEIQRKIAAGDVAAAAADIQKTYGKLVASSRELGLSTGDATRFITGATDSMGAYGDALAGVQGDAQTMQAVQEAGLDLTLQEAQGLADTATALQRARDEYAKQGKTLEDTQRAQYEMTKALDGGTDSMLEQARVALPGLQAEILRYVGKVNGIPDSKMTLILADSNPDNVQQVEDEIDAIAEKKRTAVVSVAADMTRLNNAIAAANLPPGWGAKPSTTVTINPPAGIRAADLFAAADRYARRNGTRARRR